MLVVLLLLPVCEAADNGDGGAATNSG